MHRKRNGILCLKDLKMKLHFEEGGFHIKGNDDIQGNPKNQLRGKNLRQTVLSSSQRTNFSKISNPPKGKQGTISPIYPYLDAH